VQDLSGVTYQDSFKKIIEYVENQGHSVLSELSSKFKSSIPLTDTQIYKRDLKWIDGSKVIIAEASGPSLGVGFEVSYAIFQRKIPVLVLYNAEVQQISAMIMGCDSPLLSVEKYQDDEDMKKIIKQFITKHDQN
jgi:hypothetical protein